MPNPLFSPTSLVVIDGEFSHLDPSKGSIVSWGAVWLGDPARTFYQECRLREGAEIALPDPATNNPGSLAVAGFTEEQVRDPAKPSEQQLVEAFLQWWEGLRAEPGVGMLASQGYLDIAYLESAINRYSLPAPRGYHRFFDLHTAALTLGVTRSLEIPLTNSGMSTLSLDRTATLVDLDLQRGEAHNALDDALAEAEIIHRLLLGKPFRSEIEP